MVQQRLQTAATHYRYHQFGLTLGHPSLWPAAHVTWLFRQITTGLRPISIFDPIHLVSSQSPWCFSSTHCDIARPQWVSAAESNKRHYPPNGWNSGTIPPCQSDESNQRTLVHFQSGGPTHLRRHFQLPQYHRPTRVVATDRPTIHWDTFVPSLYETLSFDRGTFQPVHYGFHCRRRTHCVDHHHGRWYQVWTGMDPDPDHWSILFIESNSKNGLVGRGNHSGRVTEPHRNGRVSKNAPAVGSSHRHGPRTGIVFGYELL